jgi:hypothetical protein
VARARCDTSIDAPAVAAEQRERLLLAQRSPLRVETVIPIEAHGPLTPVGCATVNIRQNDPHATTVVLPPDDLVARRQRKREGRLSLAQIRRLLVAAELRRRANQGE